MGDDKKVYTITELVQLGYSRYELSNDCHIRGQRFATRATPRGRFKINLRAYEKFRQEREEKRRRA